MEVCASRECGRVPKLSKHKGACVCAPHGTPQGLFTALSQFYSHFAANEAPHDPAPASLFNFVSVLPALAHTVLVHWPAVSVFPTWRNLSVLRHYWGWAGPQNTLCLKVARAGVFSSPPFPGFSSHILPGHPLWSIPLTSWFCSPPSISWLSYPSLFVPYFLSPSLFWMKAWK